jgi:hypothetical protein
MEPSIIYAIIVSGLMFLFCLRGVGNLVTAVLYSRQALTFFCRHLYSYLYHRRRLLQPISRRSTIVHFLYWAVTFVFNFIGVSSLSEGGSRAGSLAMFNFIPLFLADRLGFTADLMGLPLRTVLQLHKSVGVMTILQTAAHIALKYLSGGFKLVGSGANGNFYGLMVSPPSRDCPELTIAVSHRQLSP